MSIKSFNKILIANRGEIAVRIMKTVKKLGISSVAIYSEVDVDSYHVRYADEAFCIGDQELNETYLNVEKIISVALKSGCDAIHPGYGFLSESPTLVDACNKAGITFIGPTIEAITLMGNKIEARSFVKKTGVPMTEGITGDTEYLIKNANKIKYPILVKAAAGGGGKGMRIVTDPKKLREILETTSREALNYFGDGTIYIEKYIEEPRHIEFQVIGDNYGNVIHIFERECTIQRRYQKIIEESPSPTLTEAVRNKMGKSAVDIAKRVGYNSVGTIEFLVDNDLNFYFLEMNTRIQVEHPVTELVTGIDLVEEQIYVAAGNKLRLKQEEIKQLGSAIESRIYAEDPANNFLPNPGLIHLLLFPEGENIRIDSSIDRASIVHSFFDPMISKVIVWGKTRDKAIELSIKSLEKFIIHGIKTNIPFLINVLAHDTFRKNKLSTKFCDEHTNDILNQAIIAKKKMGYEIPIISLALYTLNNCEVKNNDSTWDTIGYWRNTMNVSFECDENEVSLEILSLRPTVKIFAFNNKSLKIYDPHISKNKVEFKLNNTLYTAFISADLNGAYDISINGSIFKVKRNDILFLGADYNHSNDDEEGSLFAPMPGKVIKVNVKKGDKVSRGKVLLVVEAMKMENNIIASQNAIVDKVSVNEGEMVDTNVQLIVLEEIK